MLSNHRTHVSLPARLRLALAAVVALAALTALPSIAKADNHGCGSTYFCLWSSPVYSQSMGKWQGNNSNLANFGGFYCPIGNWGDCNESVYNDDTSCNVGWYTATSYGGSKYVNNQYTGSGSMGSWAQTFLSDYRCP